jgi:prepilin-type N-terminal cleavage/methylation domain-containing protein
MKGRTGFSVLELMVSLAILSVAAVFIISALTKLLSPSQKAVDLSIGVVVAQSVMKEEIHAIQSDTGSISKLNFLTNDAPPSAPILGSRRVNGTDFRYEINYATLIDDITGTPLGGPNLEQRAKKVDITVWWWNGSANDARHGYGELKTQATQIFLYKPDL